MLLKIEQKSQVGQYYMLTQKIWGSANFFEGNSGSASYFEVILGSATLKSLKNTGLENKLCLFFFIQPSVVFNSKEVIFQFHISLYNPPDYDTEEKYLLDQVKVWSGITYKTNKYFKKMFALTGTGLRRKKTYDCHFQGFNIFVFRFTFRQ